MDSSHSTMCGNDCESQSSNIIYQSHIFWNKTQSLLAKNRALKNKRKASAGTSVCLAALTSDRHALAAWQTPTGHMSTARFPWRPLLMTKPGQVKRTNWIFNSTQVRLSVYRRLPLDPFLLCLYGSVALFQIPFRCFVGSDRLQSLVDRNHNPAKFSSCFPPVSAASCPWILRMRVSNREQAVD